MDAATAAPTTKTLPDGYQRTEVGVIPKDWNVKELYEIGTFAKGKGIRKSDVLDDGIPCIRYGEIYTKHDEYIKSFHSYISDEDASKAKILKSGDILFAGSGETKEEIGKCVAFLNQFEAYAGGDIVILSPLETDSKFLGFQLNSKSVNKQKAKRGQGDAVVHIYSSGLSEIKIPLPPTLKEQRAIAGALSDVDALIAELDALIEKKQQVKKGAMQQLLTGKKRLPGFSGAWEEKKLEEIGNTYNGLSGKRGADFGDGNHPYIPFLNVMNNPVIDISRFDSVKIKAGESQSTAVKGDLFFNTSSETPEEVGMCSVLLEEIENLHLNSFCFGFRLFKEDEVVPQFLAYYFRSQYGREHMKALAQGSTRYNLSKSKFIKIEVALPSYEEQKAIAQILRDMDAEIQALESKRDKYKQIKQGMMQELLTGKTRLV